MEEQELRRYSQVTTQVLIDKRLASTEKIFVALINNLSNLKGYCFSSNKYLADLLDIKERQVQHIIAKLEDLGILARVIKLNEKGEVIFRALTTIDGYGKSEKQLNSPMQSIAYPHANDCSTPHAIDCTIKENILKENIKDIISHLNKKTGKDYKPNTKTTIKLLSARLNTFTVADCKKVIDLKCNDWIKDPKMSMYLTPDTLFNESKFEKYFNQAQTLHEEKQKTEQAGETDLYKALKNDTGWNKL